MPYKNRTSFFGIPIAGKGQKISAIDEQRKANIIENQLLAATRGVKCCVFDEGEYNIVKQDNGLYSVILSSAGFSKALEGILNGGYVTSDSYIKWDGLEKGKIYYLYIKYTDKLYEDPAAFVPRAFDKKKDSSISTLLFLAVADLQGEELKINSNPDGKFYTKDVESHVTDELNPHGDILFQDKIVLLKELSFERGSGEYKETVSLINENNIDDFIIRTTVVDVSSGGKNGVSIVIDNAEEILSAHVVQLKDNVEGSKYVGDILIGLYGIDESVVSKNQVIIYNENDNCGIPVNHSCPLRVTIVYRLGRGLSCEAQGQLVD